MPSVYSTLATALLLLAPQASARQLTTFSWNAHWECAASGDHECRLAAIQKFGELTREVGAEIAVGIEIKGASGGLPGWQSSGEFNQGGVHQDAVSVLVPSSWTVHKRGGGHIESGHGDRGLAVMLVTPPFSVTGCPQLCVIGLHPGHSRITGGKNIIEGVCGASVAQNCAVASGDWNTPASEVKGRFYDSWNRLIGGTASVVAPDEVTCCHPRGGGFRFDHAGTNIKGAREADSKVWPYPMIDRFAMTTTHKPIAVTFDLPSGGHSVAPAPVPASGHALAPSCSTSGWSDVKRSCGSCKVLADKMSSRYRTCGAYCRLQGKDCVAAWEERSNDCEVLDTKDCSFDFHFTSDAICECA